MKMNRRDLLYLAILLAAQVVFFPPEAFTPSYLLASQSSDAITQHLPCQLFIRRAILEHRCIPFWNSYECAGTPAFPNPLYPTLAFPYLLLDFLPPALAINLGFIVSVVMAGVFTYLYARQVSCTCGAALFAAILFSLGARSLAHIQVGFYTKAMFFPYIPLLFLCCERCLQKPSVASSALIAVCMSLALLTGEVQLLFCVSALLALYVVIRMLVTPPRMAPIVSTSKSAGCAIAGMLLSLLLSAFYLLPAWHLYPLLTHSWPLGEGRFGFMCTLPKLALFLNPRLFSEFSSATDFPWDSALYIGIAPLLLILWTATCRVAKRDFYLWGSLLIVALLFSLREARVLHTIIFKAVPFLASFRNPGRILYCVPFFAAILAARALQRMAERESGEKGPGIAHVWLIASCALALALALLLINFSRQDRAALTANYQERFPPFHRAQHYNPLSVHQISKAVKAYRKSTVHVFRFQFLVLGVLATLVVCRRRLGISPGGFMVVVIGVTLADLFYSGKPLVEAHSLEELYPISELQRMAGCSRGGVRLLDITAPPRATFWTDMPYYTSADHAIARIDGYTPFNCKYYVRYIDLISCAKTSLSPRWFVAPSSIRRPQLLSLLGVDYVLSRFPLPRRSFTPVREFRDVPAYKQFLGTLRIPRVLLYRPNDQMPRAWLVAAAEVCSEKEEVDRLTSLSPQEKALVPPGAPLLTGGEPYRAVPISRRGPNVIALECETSRPAYLCTSEIWAPGWIARDCGRPVEVARINMIFRGMYLPPGKHSIVMSYRPPGLRMGAAISAGTLVIVIAFLTRGGWRRSVHSP